MRHIASIAGIIACAGALPAFADVTGDWQIEGSIGQMPLSVICSLKEADGKLTGSCHNEQFPDLPLTGETGEGTATWSYTVDFQGQQLTVSYSGRLESDTNMKGDIAVGGQPSGAFTATRPAPAA